MTGDAQRQTADFVGEKRQSPDKKIPHQFFRDEGISGTCCQNSTPDIPEFAKARSSPGSSFRAGFLTTAAGGNRYQNSTAGQRALLRLRN